MRKERAGPQVHSPILSLDLGMGEFLTQSGLRAPEEALGMERRKAETAGGQRRQPCRTSSKGSTPQIRGRPGPGHPPGWAGSPCGAGGRRAASVFSPPRGAGPELRGREGRVIHSPGSSAPSASQSHSHDPSFLRAEFREERAGAREGEIYIYPLTGTPPPPSSPHPPPPRHLLGTGLGRDLTLRRPERAPPRPPTAPRHPAVPATRGPENWSSMTPPGPGGAATPSARPVPLCSSVAAPRSGPRAPFPAAPHTFPWI